MAFCTSCGASLEAADRFCGKCGTQAGVQDVAAQAARPQGLKKFSTRKLVVGMLLSAVVWGGVFTLIFSSDGCSSTEGALTAQGKPVGDFVLAPTVCKSGEHESFYGVYLLGEDETAGGIKVIVDPRDGALVQLEIPGSCGSGNCTVVELTGDKCERFSVDIDQTDTYVNEIRLLDGNLGLTCAFPEGGKVDGDVKFESCD